MDKKKSKRARGDDTPTRPTVTDLMVARPGQSADRSPHSVVRQPERSGEVIELPVDWRAAKHRASMLALVPVADATRVLLPGDFEESNPIKAVHLWFDRPEVQHLVLRGNVGCGKTFAACVAAARWLTPLHPSDPGTSDFHRFSWLTAEQVIDGVLHSYRDDAPKVRKRIVIDDLGLECDHGKMAVALGRLLDTRDTEILITTNLNKEMMLEVYGLRVIDRLRDTAMGFCFNEKSRRRQTDMF